MTAPFTTLLFDFDGTLVDSLTLQLQIFNQVAAEFNLPQIKDSDLPALKKRPLPSLLREYRISPWRLARLRRQVIQGLTARISELAWLPGMQELLPKLATAYRLGVVSSNQQELIAKFLAQEKVDCFSFIHTHGNLMSKVRLLKSVLKKEKLTKTECLYIGDEIKDVISCRQIGLPVAAVSWGVNEHAALAAAQPDYLLSRVKDLANLLLPAADVKTQG